MSKNQEISDTVKSEIESRLKKRILQIDPIYGDVSSRTFFRLTVERGTVVLMRYPLESAGILDRDFTMISSFALAGLSPSVVVRGPHWFLVEDGGPHDLEDRLSHVGPEERWRMICKALQLIPRIQTVSSDVLTLNPVIDSGFMLRELRHTLDWYVGRYLGIARQGEILKQFQDLAERVGTFPRQFSHRDFHANNLLVSGADEILLVDVQDACLAPRFYDAVSLVNERTNAQLTRDERNRLLQYAAELLRAGSFSSLKEEIVVTSMQRCLKAMGTFARQVVSGREDYVVHLESGRLILRELLEESGLYPEWKLLTERK